MKKERNSSFPLVLGFIIILLAVGAGAFLLFKDTQPPTIAITPEQQNVGKGSDINISITDPGSGISKVEIFAEQDGKTIPLISKEYPTGVVQADETIILAKGELKEGTFSIKVKAQDASLYFLGEAGKSSAEKSFSYDATPPRIYVESYTNNLNQGGSGLMVFTLSEAVDKVGIEVGKRFFPAYLQKSQGEKYLYYCLYAMPWDTPPSEFKPLIIASDKAGNESRRSFNFHANARHFRHDKIRLSDSFMEQTIPEFQGLVPNTNKSAIDQYIYINNTLRKANRAKLVEFSRQTAPTLLWSGAFSRLPNAANRARFADARDYIYNGNKVDHQTHLGLDLASVKHAPVPAGNSGRIVYADFLGIYGNVVVIDHGLGLQSLYAHLSSIAVHQGDVVNRGDIIAHTGATGLAGGDHLHYGITVAGIPVQPIEWWDATWIKNNITSKIN